MGRLSIPCNAQSRLPLDYFACIRADAVPALNLAIANAGEILSGSADAHRNREALPDWLDKALGDQSDLPDIETSQLFALYMHCTYAEMEHRHAIKRSINKLVRRTLASSLRRNGARSGEQAKSRARVRQNGLITTSKVAPSSPSTGSSLNIRYHLSERLFSPR